MAFQNEVVGGITLVRPAIRSANYVAGVSGWTINADGSAEFAQGTFRGSVLVIDPVTGNVLASIGASGTVSGQLGVFQDVLFGNNESLLADMTSRGRGIVGYWDFGSNTIPAPGNGIFSDMAWVRWTLDNTRLYQIRTRPLTIQTTSLTYQNVTTQWVYTNSQAAGFTYDAHVTAVNSANGGGTQFPNYWNHDTYFADTNLAANGGRAALKLQAQCSGAGATWANPGVWGLIVEDIAPVNNAAIVARDGGIGAVAGATTYTHTYVCTASRSYDGSGNPIAAPDRDNNIYQGNISGRPYGDEQAMFIFPGATIRTDLTGATVVSATLSLYCIAAGTSQGSLAYDTATDTVVRATLTGAGPGGTYTYNNVWPVPGWHSISLLDNPGSGTAVAAIIAGANAIILDTTLFSAHATGFAGFGNSVSLRPVITIVYTK